MIENRFHSGICVQTCAGVALMSEGLQNLDKYKESFTKASVFMQHSQNDYDH